MTLDPTLRDQLAKTIHDAACACGGRTHHRHYLTAADKATELLTTQPEPVVLPTVKEAREAIIAGTKLGGWMPHTAAQAVLDLIASRVPGVTRSQALKALGNGVVPPQAAAALRLMLNRIEAA